MTGCTGRCSCEPIVGVFAPGRIPVKYEHVDRDKAHRIFTEHVLGGTPAWDLVLDTPKGPDPKRDDVLRRRPVRTD